MDTQLVTHLYGDISPKKIISHSEVQTFLDCQKKWHLRYNLKLKLETIHTLFGSMAHKVLETRIIPTEEQYQNLKGEFGIKSWHNYFTTIFNELDRRMSEYTLIQTEAKIEHDYIRGIIDCVWQHKRTGKILLTDYKFSATKKDQLDLLIDQQLYVYGALYAILNKIPLTNIEIGFITIPKTELDEPRVLAKGGLSKDKAQNTTHGKYLAKLIELNLNPADYTDILDALLGKDLVSITIGSISMEACTQIFENIEHVYNEMSKGYVLEKASSWDCRRCDLMDECKIKGVK